MSDGSCFYAAVTRRATGNDRYTDDLRQYFRETIEPTQNFPS